MPSYESNQRDDGDWQMRHVAGHFKVSRRTVERWLRDEALNFPKPSMIYRRRFWRADEIRRWRAELRKWERS